MNGNFVGLQLGKILRRAAESAGTAAALGALVFFVCAGTVEAQEAGYIRVMGRNGQMQGASTNPMYKDWIAIRSVVSAPSAADRESSAPSVSEVTATKTTNTVATTQSATSGAGAGKTAAGKPGMPSGTLEKGKTMASDSWAQKSATTATGVQSPRDASSGMATGRRMHQPITIMKEVDKATPLLFQACASGERLPLVEIVLKESGGRWLEYKLTDAIITSINKSGGNENPTESVTFTYQQIEWTYANQK